MPSVLPTLEKTWEFAVNVPSVGVTNLGESIANLLVRMFQLLEDVVPGTHSFGTGTIANVSGSTYSFNPGDTSLDPTKVGNLVGKTIQLRGSTTAANNGDFAITDQVDSGGGVYELHYVNASAAAEAMAGSVKVIGFAGFSNPWVTAYTDYRSAGAAAADDGVDRITDLSDTANLDFGQTTDDSPFCKVLRNPVTGTTFVFRGESTSSRADRMQVRVIPSGILTPALRANLQAQTDVPFTPNYIRPDGTDAQTFGFGDEEGRLSGGQYWYTNEAQSQPLRNSILHLMMSSDGKHTRLFMGTNGITQFFLFDEEVKNPVGLGSYPYVAGVMSAQSLTAPVPQFGNLNDVRAARVPEVNSTRFPTRPWQLAQAYWTAEGFISAASGQNVPQRNSVTGNQPLYRIGLQIDTALPLAQARIGELKDIWFTHDGVQHGTTFPEDGSKQFICFGDVIVPWDGASVPEFDF